MDPSSGILSYPVYTLYKLRAHTSKLTQTRKKSARLRILGPDFESGAHTLDDRNPASSREHIYVLYCQNPLVLVYEVYIGHAGCLPSEPGDHKKSFQHWGCS